MVDTRDHHRHNIFFDDNILMDDKELGSWKLWGFGAEDV